MPFKRAFFGTEDSLTFLYLSVNEGLGGLGVRFFLEVLVERAISVGCRSTAEFDGKKYPSPCS